MIGLLLGQRGPEYTVYRLAQPVGVRVDAQDIRLAAETAWRASAGVVTDPGLQRRCEIGDSVEALAVRERAGRTLAARRPGRVRRRCCGSGCAVGSDDGRRRP